MKGINMKIFRVLAILLVFFSPVSFAYSDQEVTDWGAKVMLKTLSASYLDSPADIASVRKNYMLAAWGPMTDFLVQKRAYIQQNHLILHPTPLGSAQLVDKGTCHNTPCWSVSQSFFIPEISSNVEMTLSITLIGIQQQDLIVQSMDVKFTNNS